MASPRPDGLPREQWPETVDRIDEAVAAAIRAEIRERSLRPQEVVHGYQELVRLRSGEEPDYNVRGVAVAYAFQYLVQRAASIAVALADACGPVVPSRILDVGGGNGAAIIARDALGWHTTEVVLLEPTDEMRNFHAVRTAARVTAIPGSGDDLLAGTLAIAGPFDLILISASLRYRTALDGRSSMRRRSAAIDAALRLRPLLSESGLIVGIEPAAKQMVAEFAAAGIHSADFAVRGGELAIAADPAAVRRPAPLTTAALAALRPSLAACPGFDGEVERMVGRPLVETAAHRPDLFYVATLLPLATNARTSPASRPSEASPGDAVARRLRLRRRVDHQPPTRSSPRRSGWPPLVVGTAIISALAITIGAIWWLA